MINRRILIFGLIAILGISAIKLGTNLVKDNITSKEDPIEIIRSDQDNIQKVEEEGMRKTVFYFKNNEGLLVPVMKRIPWDEGIAKTTLANMVDTTELRESLSDMGLLPLLPSGTQVNGISIDEDTGVCKVDFSKEIQNVDSLKEEENMIKGIVYTLTEFPNIKEVQILVDGNILPVLKHEVAVDKPIGRENINLAGSLDEGRSSVVVYYKGKANEEYEYFIPVTIPTLAPVANVYTALDLLFEGPPEDFGLDTNIPQDIKFQGVEVREGTAFIDINMAKDKEIDEATLDSMMKNIGLTLSEFEDIDSVELLLDGKIVNTSVPVFANEY
ncbi:GerMN domain-containing protein [Wansuia hejianensis]|uniref:GerMN domain-containing protein n=1 Tax=Wansuia hejianensis TaxID=2763667 RepID=A0A926IMM2_9FIRM|nr:GerMN domain-containing protein [Wansuia hejianensis]MBC8589798.1 GerMN domain-containing protein [Wansuia hejianensis]